MKRFTQAVGVMFALVCLAFAISPEYGGWANAPHTRFTRLVPDGLNSNQGAVTASVRGTNLGPDAGPAYLFTIQESDDDLQFVGRIAATKGGEILFSVRSDTDPLSYTNLVGKLSAEGLELYGADRSEGTLKVVGGGLVWKNETTGVETTLAP
jgi:hypothetical protein